MVQRKTPRFEALVRGVLLLLCGALVFAQLELPIHLALDHHEHERPAQPSASSSAASHKHHDHSHHHSHHHAHSHSHAHSGLKPVYEERVREEKLSTGLTAVKPARVNAHSSLTCPSPERDSDHGHRVLILDRREGSQSEQRLALLAPAPLKILGPVDALDLEGERRFASSCGRWDLNRSQSDAWKKSGPSASVLRSRAPPA